MNCDNTYFTQSRRCPFQHPQTKSSLAAMG